MKILGYCLNTFGILCMLVSLTSLFIIDIFPKHSEAGALSTFGLVFTFVGSNLLKKYR